jgi:hypothetical protein
MQERKVMREVILDERGGVIIDNHAPLTPKGVAKLVAEARKIPEKRRKEDPAFLLARIRLERAIPGMTLPPPSKGPIAERANKLRRLFEEVVESKINTLPNPRRRYRRISIGIRALQQVICQQ